MYEIILLLPPVICVVTLMYCKKEIMKYKPINRGATRIWEATKEMTEQKQKIYENIITVKELHDTLSKMIEQGYGDAPVFSKDPEHPRTFNAVYGWGSRYFKEHNYKSFYLILGIDEVEYGRQQRK